LKAYRTGSGRIIRTTSIIGKGGEGTVFHVEGESGTAAKIYTDGKQESRRGKISAMVSRELHKKTNFVAFPTDTLIDESGRFVGFTMRKIGGVKPIHELYAPGSRKIEFPRADFRFLARVATNVARAITSVHETGCVIGDINHSGILVGEQATVTLIDADSFQFKDSGTTFRCVVGVGEYTPPELQGHNFEAVDRLPEHDVFGLAVIAFQLLFMGRQPFSGRYAGREDMPIERAIKEGRFAYSIRRKLETRMEPPPFVPTLADLPTDLANAFEQAFMSTSATTVARPLPARWVDILRRFEEELISCKANPAHHHLRNAAHCPWCRLEAGLSVSLFPGAGGFAAQHRRSNFDLNAAMAAIDRVLGPGSITDPRSVVPEPTGLRKSSEVEGERQSYFLRKTGGVLLALGCVLAAVNGMPIALWGMIPAGIMFFGATDPSTKLGAIRFRAGAEWEAAVDEWELEAGDARFDKRKNEFAGLAAEYRTLPALERTRLAELDKKREELQRQRFLEGHLLTRAKIPGIGDGRKAVLSSYGIENAFDLNKYKILAVPGFGEVMAKNLMTWRRSVERRFTFNSALGTDPVAIQQVKDAIARRQNEIETALSKGPTELQQIRAHALTRRSTPTPRMVEAYRALKQAEMNAS